MHLPSIRTGLLAPSSTPLLLPATSTRAFATTVASTRAVVARAAVVSSSPSFSVLGSGSASLTWNPNRKIPPTAEASKKCYSSAATMAAVPIPKRRLQKPAIFVCDLQEKFRNAIWEFDKVILTTNKLLKAASVLSIPVYATTQNASRLGTMVPEVQTHLDTLAKTPSSSSDSGPLLRCLEDKTLFSMWVPPLATHFQSSSPSEIAIVGIESHICVTQTALDALAAGHKVYIIADGVSSCNREEVGVALARLEKAGATVTTSESWMYEVMGDAGIAEFKKMVGLVKETVGDTKVALKALRGKI